MPLQLITAPRPLPHPVIERHNHIRVPALRLLVLGICYPADVLRLVAVLIGHIPLNPLLFLSLTRLVRLVLRVDPVEPPGASTRYVIKLTAKDTIVEITT